MRIVDVYTEEGTFLGERQAFDLNQPEMDRFIGRTTRALLYHDYRIGFAPGQVEWRMAPAETTIQALPTQIKELFRNATPRSIGGDVFSYIGFYKPGTTKSLWLLNFYGGVEFMAIFRARKE
jgi:hypothetical protein